MGYTLKQTQKAFTDNLDHLGFASTDTNQGDAIIGLRLRD
jgi:hypothetical protein